jgi:16S rRNA (cytosine967-C5)-methyltransferase
LANWQTLFGASGVLPVSKDGATVTLSPASTDTDGFFFAMMRRKA